MSLNDQLCNVFSGVFKSKGEAMKEQYANQMANPYQPATSIGLANQLQNQQAQMNAQMQQLAGTARIYRGEDVKAKYRHTNFSVQEISNGYTVILGEETYFCEDIAAVGARVTMVLATQVLAK